MDYELKNTQLNNITKNQDGSYTLQVLVTPQIVEAPDARIDAFNILVNISASLLDPILLIVNSQGLSEIKNKYPV